MGKRAEPIGAEDIGIWEKIFSMTTYAGVISNAGISMFVMTDDKLFEGLTYSTKIWYFIIFQYVLLTLMTALDEAIADVPEDVITQQKRSEFFEECVITPADVTYADRTHDSHYHETLQGSVFMD